MNWFLCDREVKPMNWFLYDREVKSMNWFLYNRGLRHGRVKKYKANF